MRRSVRSLGRAPLWALVLAVAALVTTTPAPVSAYAVSRTGGDGARDAVTSSGELTLRVPEVAVVREAVEQLTTSVGGRVLAWHPEQESGRLVGTTLSLEVPKARFGAVMTTLSGLGRVEDRQQTSRDLSTDLVDLERDLALQDATVTRLEVLTGRAGTTTDRSAVAQTVATAREAADSTRRSLAETRARARSAHVELALTDGTPRRPQVIEEGPPGSPGRAVVLTVGALLLLLAGGWLWWLSARSAPARTP